MNGNDFFAKMCAEAAEELARGDLSWKDAHPNVLLLAAFGVLSTYLTSKLVKPLWFFASSAFGAAVAYILSLITG